MNEQILGDTGLDIITLAWRDKGSTHRGVDVLVGPWRINRIFPDGRVRKGWLKQGE